MIMAMLLGLLVACIAMTIVCLLANFWRDKSMDGRDTNVVSEVGDQSRSGVAVDASLIRTPLRARAVDHDRPVR